MFDDLYDALKHLVATDKIKIGFHKMRNPNEILLELKRMGVKKGFFEDPLEFIRKQLNSNKDVFDACRKYMDIMIYMDGKEHNWDGYGKIAEGTHWLRSEILYRTYDAPIDAVAGLLEGVEKP